MAAASFAYVPPKLRAFRRSTPVRSAAFATILAGISCTPYIASVQARATSLMAIRPINHWSRRACGTVAGTRLYFRR